MIAETIRQLQSEKWYGCGEHVEIAKGKNAIPKTWSEAKEKVLRVRYMEVANAKDKVNRTGIIKRLTSWLLNRK